MEDSEPGDGDPLFVGDVITLFAKTNQGYMIADGFNTTELIFKKQTKFDLSCQWQICPKLNYQQQKILNKVMKTIGLTDPQLMDDAFCEEHEVSPEERAEVVKRSPLVEKEIRVNEDEAKRMRGTPLLYGDVVQLKHVRSGKILSLTKGTGRKPGTFADEVIDNGDEGSWFKMMPGFKVRAEGDQVVVTDQIQLQNVKKSSPENQIFLHLDGDQVGKNDGLGPDETEIHGWEVPSKFTINRFARFDEQGGAIICSGAFARIMNKEEEAFITFGPVDPPEKPGAAPVKGKTVDKLHLLSVAKEASAATCSNAMFELVQTDQVDIKVLIETIRRKGRKIFPKEVGGNISWDNLMRLKHVGTQKFLAASFVHEEDASGEMARHTRFYLAELEEERDGAMKPVARAHLESLWNVNPVNPCDLTTKITLSDVFHLQHVATGDWVHAGTEESDDGVETAQYYDSDAEGRGKRSQRMLQLVPDKPYEDAFGFGVQDPKTHDEEVRDLNYIRTVLPEFEKYVQWVNNQIPITTAKYLPIKKLLTDLIVNFMTYGTQDLNPLTRVGLIKSPRRQQLLREQKLLDVLMLMTTTPIEAGGYLYDNLKADMPNLWDLGRLANKLIYHALRKNETNCLYMIQMDYISDFQDQLGGDLGSDTILTELHLDNKSALERLPEHSFQKWVVMMDTSVTDGRGIAGRLGLAATFLGITCICKGDPIRSNQNAILKYLFGVEKENGALVPISSEIYDPLTKGRCVCQFKLNGVTVEVKNVARNGTWVHLDTIFGDETPEGRELKKFVVGSVELYANLCSANRDCQKEVAAIMPVELVKNIIMTDRKGCDDLRAACCEVLFRLYVDSDGNSPVLNVNKTRKFEDIEPQYADMLVLRDDYPFPDIKDWIVDFLSEPEHMAPCAQKTNNQRNKFVVAVLKMIMRLLNFGVYTATKELEQMLVPLLKILDGSNDRPDPELEGAFPGGEWRFPELPENTLLMSAKLVICQIMIFVQDVRMNLRMTRTLLNFRDQLDRLRSSKAEPGSYSEKQICKYIVSGSPLKKAAKKKQWSKVCGKVPEIQEIFGLLDFSKLAGKNIDVILFDLTQYKNPLLKTEATRALVKQYMQRKNLTRALAEVQLLCSKTDIGFYELAKSMLSALTEFMKSDFSPAKEREVRNKLMSASSELINAKSAEEFTSRQQLFKNVKFPEMVIKILELGLRPQDKFRPEHMPSSTEEERQKKRDLSRVPMFMACYGFLLVCCKGNNLIKDSLASRQNFAMYIEHLDITANKTGDGVIHKIDVHARQLVLELFRENQKLVNTISAEQIKKFVSLIVNNGRTPEWLQFLEGIVVVKAKNDDKKIPVKRNQQLVIKALIQNKSKTMTPSLYKNPEEWETCVELMEKRDHEIVPPTAGGLQYHIELVDLLYKCAQGKNKAAEQLCQAEVPLDAVVRGLVDPRTIPVVKQVYLNFLWESYIELERPKKATPTSKGIWACLERLALDLRNSQLNMISETRDSGWIISEIQYLYRVALPFLTKWYTPGTPYSYSPDSWEVTPEEKERLMRISSELFDGLCTLLEKPADPSCQINIVDAEVGYKCAMTMMDAGVKTSDGAKKILATSFADKGRELLQKVDQFKVKAGMPPKETLIQMALSLFAKDFDECVTEEEEIVNLAEYCRYLLKGKEGNLIRGDERVKVIDGNVMHFPDVYVEALVKELEHPQEIHFESLALVNNFKHNLAMVLRLMLDEEVNPFKSGKSEKDKAKNKRLRTAMQNRMCGYMNVPRLICNVMSQQNPPVEDSVAASTLQLFFYLVRGGNSTVQSAFIKMLSQDYDGRSTGADMKRTERFFGALELRFNTAVNEAKTSRNFYLQKAETAMEKERQAAEQFALNPEKPDKTLVAIDRAREPPEEVFAETSSIAAILMVMQQLCEDNFQPAKELLANQLGSDMNHNLCRSAVQYMDIWQKNMGAHNIHLGKTVFATLTELVIGPCFTNQQELASEIKIDTINALLEIDYATTDCDLVELCTMQRRCVQMLQAMLEGCADKADRVVKALSDMKPISDNEHKLYQIIKRNIIEIHSEMLSHTGIVRQTMNKIHKRGKHDPGRLKLGFQYLTFLRQLHDCMDDPKRSVPFYEEMMRAYEVTATQKDQRRDEEAQYAKATVAFTYFLERMGRIEIRRISRDQSSERIERAYFEIPRHCLKLTEETKEAMKWSINRDSDEERLKDFIERADAYEAEMNLQKFLSRLKAYKFFDYFREEWKSMTYYISYLINAMLLLGVDHEDKFYQDPIVDLTGKKGTPFNVIDAYSFNIIGWKKIELFYGNLAYMPMKMHDAIWFLGWVMILFSAITWVIFVIGFGPLIAREQFKVRHNNRQAAKREVDPNYEVMAFDFELEKGTMFYRPIYFFKYISYVCTEGRFIYLGFFYMGLVLVGHFASQFAYSLLLMDILKREEELKSAMEAISKPISKIIKVLILAIIVMYVFTIIGFAFFHEQFNDGDAKQDNMCNSVLQCMSFTMYHGLISSELWFAMAPADLWPIQPYGVSQDTEVRQLVVFTIRVLLDMAFFLFVGVILIGGVLFGIILDNFSEIRSTKEEIMDKHTNICFICLIDRNVFDRANGFNTHVHDDHNMWTYIYFIVYLLQMDKTEVNGAEAYVLGKLMDGVAEGESNIEWLPQYKAMVLKEEEQEEEALSTVNRSLGERAVDETLICQVEHMKSEGLRLRKNVEEMLSTVKEINKNRQQG
jgi:hypothetical protein